MNNKKIFVFLFNGFSDWEIAYITPEIKKSEELKYMEYHGYFYQKFEKNYL